MPPIHPGLAAGIFGWHGRKLAAGMQDLPRLNILLALQRDGFDEQSPGGEVQLQGDGRGILDYPLNDHLWDGVRRAWHAMAEIQFAAGACAVMPGHLGGEFDTSLAFLRDNLGAFKLEVAKSYASISYLKEVERRITDHLIRIEDKIDAGAGR